MEIRKASAQDLDQIMQIYENAKAFMRENGNKDQWGDDYPSRELIEQDLDAVEEDTVVSLAFDKERLYKNMVAAEADWLYNLEEWNDIFDEETRKELYKEQKSSTTIVKEQKVYPNDPCPCGSGKKYKKCCGRK